jgi:hypothetical protein
MRVFVAIDRQSDDLSCCVVLDFLHIHIFLFQVHLDVLSYVRGGKSYTLASKLVFAISKSTSHTFLKHAGTMVTRVYSASSSPSQVESAPLASALSPAAPL